MKFFAVIPTILADASAKVRLPIAAQYIDTWSLQWSLWLCSSDTAAYAAPAATAVDAKFAYGAPVTALNTGPLTAGPVATAAPVTAYAAAAPAVAAALALAATATIFGAQYAAAYTPAVVPAVAVTPVAYATMLPQLLYAAIMVSLIMVSLMLSEPLHQNLIYKEALPTILIKDDLQVIS